MENTDQITIEYCIPLEVTKEKFDILRNKCGGILAFREDKEKYFIKLFMSKYQSLVETLLNQ